MSKENNRKTALSVVSSRDRTPVKWDDIQKNLPDTIQQQQGKAQGEAITNPWVQSGLNSLANVAPSLHTAAKSGQFLKIIGPPEALDGTLGHLTDKQGNILGGLVDEAGTLRGQTRFEDAGNALNTTAAAAATFQVLSVVTAQYYLHEISSSLKNIEGKIDDLKIKLESQQLGEIQGAVDTIDEIYDANVRHIEKNGTAQWQAPDKTEFWTRMANVEMALRKHVISLENEISHELKKITDQVRDDNERHKESFNEHRELLEELKEFHNTAIVQYYLLALRGMMRWYQLTLAFDAHTWNGMENGRYETMVKFVKQRSSFLSNIQVECDFVLERPNGTSWKDNAITTKEKSALELSSQNCLLLHTGFLFNTMNLSFASPQAFNLESRDTGGIPKLCLLVAEKEKSCV